MKKITRYVKDLEALSEGLENVYEAYRSGVSDRDYRFATSNIFQRNRKDKTFKRASDLLSKLNTVAYDLEFLTEEVNNLLSDLE